MTTTMGQMADAEPALSRLLSEKLPLKTSYALTRLSRLAGEELKQWHEKRTALITEHGTEGAEAGTYVVTPGMAGFEAFVAAMTELAAVEVELAWSPVSMDAMGDVTITPADLSMLVGVFIVDPDAEQA